MRLILVLSIALGTANLQVGPTTVPDPDRMTRASDSTHAHVAARTHAGDRPRQASTIARFDRRPALARLAAREVRATQSVLPTAFTMRMAPESASTAADDVTITEAVAASIVR